eukprot:1410327-Prymnesium_polylepis.1
MPSPFRQPCTPLPVSQVTFTYAAGFALLRWISCSRRPTRTAPRSRPVGSASRTGGRGRMCCKRKTPRTDGVASLANRCATPVRTMLGWVGLVSVYEL